MDLSTPPPTKPPRGVKQGKETSGLLMSVIRTLSATETNEQREKERVKLEKEYKKSDARLDELVAEHAQEIMEVMEKFSNIGSALSVWGQHCDAAVARLAACRGLLKLRRDDLRRLWADARTHHYALNMLTDIDGVVESEREARALMASGRVLAAATTLRDALDTHATTLAHVTALHSTKEHLEVKKQELVMLIIRNISEAVYRSDPTPLTRRLSARRRTALLLAELTKSEEVTDAYLQDITPEFEASLTEEDKTFETTVMISLEALGVLEQLRDATEKFKCQIQNELLEVIENISRRIIEEGDVEADLEEEGDVDLDEGDGVSETGRPLARLVASLAEEFRACGARNKRLLQLWRAALQKHKILDSCLHTQQHYWSAVQQVLQLLLTEYLQIESVTLAATKSGGGGAVPVGGAAAHAPGALELRLSDYFGKKRPSTRRPRLIKLNAAAGVGVPAAGGGVGGADVARGGVRVCRPHPAHLHALLPALHALCAHIEHITGSSECSLRAFITDYVRTGESERLASAARAGIDAAMRAPGAWRERQAVDNVMDDGGSSSVVIFSCCEAAWRCVRESARAVRRCGPTGGAEALRALSAPLATLAQHSRAGQARVVPAGAGAGVGAGGAASRAARWVADDDIVRFLQALPNWRAALTHPATEHTAQELNQAFEREAEILGSSLGDGAVTRREIIADVNALADLALMCQSMDWLSANIETIPSIVGAPSAGGGCIKLTDKFLNDITSAAMIFDEIAHKCLLFLHLELRIQCFHYLGQERGVAGGGVEGEDDAGEAGGEGAARLAHALLAFHEHAAPLLPSYAMPYVLNGLGEMMSAAVIWRWQNWSVGLAEARLATLRHCLAALHLPHSGLHRAHHYLQLLACTHQEIINSVREKGAQFSELEYLNAFKVIGARSGLSPADMKAQLKQLSAALGHVGVTV